MSTISASTTTTTAYKVTADTTGALVLQTGATPTTAVTIDTSQNVGIGTASPSYKLDITGQGRATTGFAVSADGSTFTPSGLNAIPNYGVGYITSTSQTTLSGFGGIPFYTNQVERMRIDSSGNVGIGTASVGGKLTVAGAAGGVAGYFTDSTNSSLVVATLLGGVTLGTDGGGQIHLATNGSAAANRRLSIDASGNVKLATAGTVIQNSSGNPILQQTGSVLQVVSAFKNDGFSSTSTTFVDITGLSVSITPTSATSKILILVTSNFSAATGNAPTVFNLVRNSTNIATPATAPTYNGTVTPYIAGNISDQSVPWSASFLDSPATTSATTYKVQGRGSSGTNFYVNRRATADFNSTSSITVMEIAA